MSEDRVGLLSCIFLRGEWERGGLVQIVGSLVIRVASIS
uniref:Uncharacterized protein n=1 Tax=Candidatus Methanogaster sp. ANME-2c ERB4 TaxID=2759911 RepID=A0A7G9YL25_9EURY|nr:hypothetical protein MNILOELO_00011 [Methanosarcinales archaeon ANME-2c ERB4]